MKEIYLLGVAHDARFVSRNLELTSNKSEMLWFVSESEVSVFIQENTEKLEAKLGAGVQVVKEVVYGNIPYWRNNLWRAPKYAFYAVDFYPLVQGDLVVEETGGCVIVKEAGAVDPMFTLFGGNGKKLAEGLGEMAARYKADVAALQRQLDKDLAQLIKSSVREVA